MCLDLPQACQLKIYYRAVTIDVHFTPRWQLTGCYDFDNKAKIKMYVGL